MELLDSFNSIPINRRRFLTAGAVGASVLALYSGELERHWIEVTRHDVALRGLHAGLNGLRIAQLSDIHMDEYTEPFFLRQVVEQVNAAAPDVVLVTGDFVSEGPSSRRYALRAASKCARILGGLKCRQTYAVLGNHDVVVDARAVTAALAAKGITVLKNAYLPLDRNGGRMWLAGIDDPVMGKPDVESAVPSSIRNLPNQPVILMCHAPDYADKVLQHPAGKAIDLMISGHTHGGQIRLPLVGALELPELGKKYVEGWFRLGDMRLYVNRGIGTVGLPFRLDCPPEITVMTLQGLKPRDV